VVNVIKETLVQEEHNSQLMVIVAASLVCSIIFVGAVGCAYYKWRSKKDAEQERQKIEDNLSK
jgi:putative effector of murein hydrolase LrgA (UPF0299 family)